jgi:hypothetical protein
MTRIYDRDDLQRILADMEVDQLDPSRETFSREELETLLYQESQNRGLNPQNISEIIDNYAQPLALSQTEELQTLNPIESKISDQLLKSRVISLQKKYVNLVETTISEKFEQVFTERHFTKFNQYISNPTKFNSRGVLISSYPRGNWISNLFNSLRKRTPIVKLKFLMVLPTNEETLNTYLRGLKLRVYVDYHHPQAPRILHPVISNANAELEEYNLFESLVVTHSFDTEEGPQLK